MNNPLFSVLIANYNNGKYLDEALLSVISQTYSNWEIVLVDDGSIDDSVSVYNKYNNDNRIKIFYNKDNQGCGYTKRRCIAESKGEFCGFLDADDVLLPGVLELMVNIHNNHPDVSVVFSKFYECDENLNILAESRPLNIPKGKSYLENGDYQPEHFSSFKRSFYNKTAGISESLKLGVDQDLYFKLEEAGNIFISNELTYKYRIHLKNNSASDKTKAFYWNTIIRHEACVRRGIDPENISYKQFALKLQDMYQRGINDKSKTLSFKIGHLLLYPFRLIRRMINIY